MIRNKNLKHESHTTYIWITFCSVLNSTRFLNSNPFVSTHQGLPEGGPKYTINRNKQANLFLDVSHHTNMFNYNHNNNIWVLGVVPLNIFIDIISIIDD